MKNRSLIIGGIVLSLMIVLSIGTYAYWTITKSQDGANTLIGGCLNVDITEESAAISLDKAWPISDFEGMQLEGYTFTVTNECSEPQDYRIDLDRLVDSEGRKEMSNDYLATLLDYGVPVMYEELEPGETTDEEVKEKRVLAYDTVAGKVGDTPGSNTHTLRLWIDEESPVSEQGSTFLSRVEINAGQGIEKYYTPEECFTFDAETGSITAYDETKTGCTTDVVIPYEIAEVAVTEIGTGAFREKGLTSVEFPRSVTILGMQSFRINPTIEKIIFRDGLTTIGSGAFMGTSDNDIVGILSFISLPRTITTIKGNAFKNNSIEQVVIPDELVLDEVGDSATIFYKNKIKNIKFGENTIVLGTGMFSGNEIEELIIPDHVTIVGNSAFANNPLKKLTIGENVTSIGSASFGNNFSKYLNYYNQNFLTEVFIPSNLTNIEMYAFGTATSDVIIRTERTKDDFLANVTAYTQTNREWYGQAQVISSDGLNIYE